MDDNNIDATQEEESCAKPCFSYFFVFLVIVAIIITIVFVINKDSTDSPTLGINKDNTDRPTLLTRKATLNDISISSDESNIISIELIVVPKYDIDNLEITINYYNDSKTLLKTQTKDFGDVKKGGRYTEQIYITDFSISQIFELEYCRYTVTGGTVSYFS